MDFSQVTYDQIIGALLSLHAIAVVVVNITTTPTDNAFLAKAYRFVEMAAGFISWKSKQ